MEIVSLYLKILSDTSIPVNRVVRKSTILVVLMSIVLIAYRHLILGFSTGTSIFGTLAMIFILIFMVGMLGGILAGAAYEWVMKYFKANTEIKFSTFIFEWLAALTPPALTILITNSYAMKHL